MQPKPKPHPGWEVIRDGLRASGRSTQQLAMAARVSTKTVQRVLDKKDLPDLADPGIREEWTRIITWLARAVKADPVVWLSTVGMDKEAAQQGLLRVALSVGDPFHLKGSRASFFYRYARRLTRWTRRFRVDEDAVFDWALDTAPRQFDYEAVLHGSPGDRFKPADLLVGLMNTAPRRQSGVDFLPIPGIGYSLDAVFYHDPAVIQFDDGAPTWKDVEAGTVRARLKREMGGKSVTSEVNLAVRVLLVRDEAGHDYLAGSSERDAGPQNVEFVPDGELASNDIAARLRELQRAAAGRENVLYFFVADAGTCLELKLFADRGGRIEPAKAPTGGPGIRGVRWSEEDARIERYYPIAIAMREDSEWRGPLADAQHELFRVVPDQMAVLYADLLVEGYEHYERLRRSRLDPVPLRLRGSRAGDGERVTFQAEFRQALCSGLLARLLPSSKQPDLGEVADAVIAYRRLLPNEKVWARTAFTALSKELNGRGAVIYETTGGRAGEGFEFTWWQLALNGLLDGLPDLSPRWRNAFQSQCAVLDRTGGLRGLDDIPDDPRKLADEIRSRLKQEWPGAVADDPADRRPDWKERRFLSDVLRSRMRVPLSRGERYAQVIGVLKDQLDQLKERLDRLEQATNSLPYKLRQAIHGVPADSPADGEMPAKARTSLPGKRGRSNPKGPDREGVR